MNGARVIKVIETKSVKGEGTENDAVRLVTQFWDFKGNLLAENDPWKLDKEREDETT